MITAFICANIYGILYVCQIQTIRYKEEMIYKILLTDNRWYKVNRCTAERAKVGKPFKKRYNTTFCI